MTARRSPGNSPKHGRAASGWLAALWIVWAVGLLVHGGLRGLGDEWRTPLDIKGTEQALLFVVPPEWLQENIQRRDLVALDYFGFLNHVFWFPLPLLMGLALTRKKPAVVGEFFAWIVTLSLIAALAFVLFPVIPPWMEGGSTRVLVERAFTDYTTVDNNPVAAFPSMHAAVPMLMGLFFWHRCREDGRPLAWLCLGYAVTVGFSVVYLGEHWLLDVFAGYALAAVVAWAFLTGAVRRATRIIPGDPVGWLICTNERLLAPSPEVEVPAHSKDPPTEMEPVSLPRAA